MLDKVELRIGGKKIEHFERYSIEGHLYTADHAWSMELANPVGGINPGQLVEVWINGLRELAGIADCVGLYYVKKGRVLRIEGRDLMGYLVDSCCTAFPTLKGMTLKALAQTLLEQVPKQFRTVMNVTYQENMVGRLKLKKGKKGSIQNADEQNPQAYSQIEPGMTIFEVLREYAHSRGLLFWCDTDGSFTFGRPRAAGGPKYNIVTRISRAAQGLRDGQGNNAIAGELIQNISRRYSECIITGQQQGTDSLTAAEINTMATKRDETFPFYKPLVRRNNNDASSPALEARMELEKRKAEGFALRYTVAGHSQNGTNWRINEMTRVTDEVLGINGSYLIYGRTFIFDRDYGPQTELVLGYPGIIE